MHYHCEIIMPPTDDVEDQIKAIMQPFSENNEDSENYSGHSFWDWYVIGGRWAGEHLKASVDAEQLDKFNEELKDLKITVSGMQCGKQELQPASQVPTVDKLWRKYFPDSELNTCPLFSHFNDQYKDNCLDVDTFEQTPQDMTASRVIIAGPSYRDSEAFEAQYMVEDSIWNGVVHQDTTWDGTLSQAVEQHNNQLEGYTDEAKAKYTIQPDWLVATVDYHS